MQKSTCSCLCYFIPSTSDTGATNLTSLPPNAGCCHLVIGEFNEIILEMLAIYFESFPGVLLTQFFTQLQTNCY